ncbi:hypothetical protein vBDshSR4C_032 [Dinoroseobacter phage vB_DshS-R4C]|nr:hypothetical protein vBDshSR4C_032 [Dinoroseobacter phage vB_DshS-R4C]
MPSPAPLTAATLIAFGKALYGENWIAPLGRDLRAQAGAPSDRTLARWASGAAPIPPGLRVDLEAVIADHAAAVDAARRVLAAQAE